MPRYYFDTRDGSEFVRDEIGIELDGVEAARDEATRGLADFARDALPGSVRRELAVECRDEADRDAPSPESPLTEVLRNSGGEFGRKGLVYGRTVSGNLECSGA